MPVSSDDVTPEEAAALARRIRVESKLPRIAVVGTVLGLVCGVAAIWPFLDSDGFMANSLVGRHSVGPMAFLPGWLLAGFLPLLAFYAGRLHFETGRSSTGQIETSLRKIRLLILGSMFASAAAFVFVLMQPRDHTRDTPWLPLVYLACFSACGFIVGDVRRGLGDFDTDYQRRRRRLARGFMVELNPVQTPGSQDAIPVAALAEPPTAAPRPPPLPAAVALPVAEVGEDEHFKDLRLLMTLAIVTAIFVHAVRLGETFTPRVGRIEQLFSNVVNTLPGGVPVTSNPLAALASLAALLAAFLLLPCGILWLVWGILALNYGPVFRRTVGWLAGITLILAVLQVLPVWIGATLPDYSRVYQGQSQFAVGRLSSAPEMIHCLLICALLTRPGIKRLFASRSREVDALDRP